jgi:hypothetical protein
VHIKAQFFTRPIQGSGRYPSGIITSLTWMDATLVGHNKWTQTFVIFSIASG